MQNVGLVLLVFSFVIACIAVRIGTAGTWSLFPLAFALYVAAQVFGGIGRAFGWH